MIKYAFVVDPGLTTGFGLVRYYPDRKDFEILKASENNDPLNFVHDVNDFLEQRLENVTVVCESFIITANTAKKTQAPWSLEIIGALKYLCYRYNYPFVLQAPADAKSFADNDKLRRAGFWQKSLYGDGDVNDAMRHMLLWLVKEHAIDPTTLIPSEDL